MLDIMLWVLFGWLLGVSVAVALGTMNRSHLAWNGILGIVISCLAGGLLAPALHMPAGGLFSLAALSVASVSCILLVLLGNVAAWLARRQSRQDMDGWTA